MIAEDKERRMGGSTGVKEKSWNKSQCVRISTKFFGRHPAPLLLEQEDREEREEAKRGLSASVISHDLPAK